MEQTSRELSWVESPLQLIAAAEYAASRGTAVDVALRVGPQMAETAERLLDLRALFSTVEPYIGIPWGLLRSRRSWLIGDGFSGQFQLAMSSLGARRVTLLDDGMMTIHLARALADGDGLGRPGHRASTVRTLIASLTRDRLLALAARETLSFYTVFAGHDALRALPDHGIRVAENGFDWIRSIGRPVELAGDTVVLGAAAVADDAIGSERYLDWVRRTVRDADRPVSYLPHRREPVEILRALDGIPNVTVVHTGIPVELALAGMQRTLEIVTLPSTAAVTLRTVLAGTGSSIRTHHLRERVR